MRKAHSRLVLMALMAMFSGASAAEPATVAGIEPSPLLVVEKNRAAIVQRIVAEWTSELSSQTAASMTAEQLSKSLWGLRSDRLLAAGLAGSFADLRGLLDGADRSEVVDARATPKALGDANADLVYTPVTPCRIADTRVAGGALTANVQRTFDGFSANFSTQGGTASNCGIPSGVAALALNLYAVNPTNLGFIKVWPANAAEPAVSTVNYQVGIAAIATGAIVPVDSANSNRFLAKSPAVVDMIADVVGYFKAPSPIIANGGVTSAMLANSSVSLSKIDTASVDARYVRKSFVGTQASGTVAAGAQDYWFTFGWPAATRIVWRAVPTTTGGKVQLVSQEIERAADGTYTYWLLVKNTGTITTGYDLQRFGID